MYDEIAILILAAGESKRLGQPKQLLQYKGKRLINHVIDEALNTECDNIYVVLGAQHVQILEEIESKKISTYHNANWNEGMGVSLAFGCKNIMKNKSIKAILVLLCDQVLVNTKHIKALMDKYLASGHIVVSSYEDSIGVPVIFPDTKFKDILKLKGDKGAKQILKNNFKQLMVIQFASAAIDIDCEKDILELKHGDLPQK